MSNVISEVIAGSKGRPMAIDLHLPEAENPPVVIMVHGFKGFKDWGHFSIIADEFAKSGFAFIRFNFSHNGTTLDNPSDFADLDAFAENNLIKELDDVQIVVNALMTGVLFSESSLNLEDLFLIGHSRGGGIAIISTAEDNRVKGLATWASVNHYDRGGYPVDAWEKDGRIFIPNARTGQQMPMNWQFVEVLKANEGRLNILEQAAKVIMPTLVVHGTEDPTVPYVEAEELAQSNPQFKLMKVMGGDHSFGGKHPMESNSLSDDMKVVVERTIQHFRSIVN